jgi:type I restriction enzyme M protein
MAIKKSELYSSIWRSCDELRGGMDASQYKDYVLVLLFVKYVSDKYAGQKDAMLEVPKGGSFADMVALQGNKEIGDRINKIIAKLAEANGLKGVIDQTDFNDEEKLGKGKEMVDRLSNLVGIFNSPDLDFRRNRADGDDLLGDAYEYLMRNFATESGKSKGQFYTPAEVSRVIAKVIGVSTATSAKQSIYDPTCGSGSLLLKAHDEAKHQTGHDLGLWGQEMDVATTALAKMNMILHGCETVEIAPGGSSTLANPFFRSGTRIKTFDYAVANPPFSSKAWSSGFDPSDDLFRRFEFGIPPAKNGDYAFLLHILASLNSNGKGAVILPHGVLFRGNAEAEIRKQIVRQGYIKGIIGLPANLFFGTGIPACIVVLDKERAAARKGIFLIDASKGFIKDGNKNRLRDQDIHKIVDAFTRLAEIPRYSRMVPFAEIEANDYNLNIPRYIDSTEPEDLQDIEAHLRGGIPNRDLDDLARFWEVFPGIRGALFGRARAGYSKLKVKPMDVKTAIFEHEEFATFQKSVLTRLAKWRRANEPRLKNIAVDDKPKALIETLSEELLKAFQSTALLDSYDVYQRLMTYWAETMQDDVYLLVGDGWNEAAKLRLITDDYGRVRQKPDLVVGKQKFRSELIPPVLVVARYFAREREEIDCLESKRAVVEQKLDGLKEEHSTEEGLLEAVIDDKGNVSKAAVSTRIAEIRRSPECREEYAVLNQYSLLLQEEADASRRVKDAQRKLDEQVVAKYTKLTEAEIQTLVVNEKWLARLEADVHAELDRVSHALADRLRQLAERYETPLAELMGELESLSATVGEHLGRMGAVC